MKVYLAVYADTSDMFNQPLGVASTLDGAKEIAWKHFSERTWEQYPDEPPTPPSIRWEPYTDEDRTVVQQELLEHGTLDIEKWGGPDEYAIYGFEMAW